MKQQHWQIVQDKLTNLAKLNFFFHIERKCIHLINWQLLVVHVTKRWYVFINPIFCLGHFVAY